MFASISAMLTLLPFVLEQHYGLTPTVTGGVMSMIAASMMVGCALSGFLGKQFAPLTLLRGAMLPLLLITSLSAGLASRPEVLTALAIPRSAWWPIPAVGILLVILQGFMVPICQALYLNPFRDTAGVAAGTASLMQTLMMAVGSWLASTAWQHAAAPRMFYGVLATIMLSAQLWFWLLLGWSETTAELQSGGAGKGADERMPLLAPN